MSDIAGGYTSPYSSPTFTYNMTYSQTGRTGSSVSYHFNIASSLGSSSSFGYSLGYSLTINGQNKTGTIKTNNTWTGAGTWNTGIDVTVSAGASGGTLSAQLIVTRPGGEGNSGKLDTGAKTMSITSWNTAPKWNTATCSVSPSGTIAEDVPSLTVSWGSPTDTEGGTMYYTVKRYVNDVYSATIASGLTSRSCVDNIGSGNQGKRYKYSVEANDGSLWCEDGAKWSNVVTKNLFTKATLSTSASVTFATTSVALSYSGASNTNGSASFYSLSCSNVTVYNPTSSPSNVTIYRSGTLPSGTYIKFADIKSATSSANYTGTFTFTLTTTNSYGSSGYSSCTMWVDLRTNPTAFSVSGTSGYYNINATNYYVSNRRNPTVTWGASTDQLGGSISYDIQVKLGTGNFSTVLSNLKTTSASVPVGSVSSRTSCVIRVLSKTSFGYTNHADSSSVTLDYYNPPSITFSPTLRNMNDMTASGTVAINTSIPSITITTLTYVGKTSGSLTLAKTFSKQETSLIDGDTYSFSVTAQDGAGSVIGTPTTTASTKIPKYTPMFSLRELGVGVNAYADTNNKLIVGGNAKINGVISNNLGGTSTAYDNLVNYTYGGGNITGVLKITLPVGWTSTMFNIEIDGYDYSSTTGSWKLILGGYNFITTPQWYNTSAQLMGEAPFKKVRFAYDGSKCCILIGELTTIWSYPKVIISRVLAGNTSHAGLENGWTASMITSETGITVSGGIITDASSINITGGISANGGRIVLRDNSIEEWATNGNTSVSVNYYGYGGGTTQFRDHNIYNGKGGLIAQFIGSSGKVDFNGDLTVPSINGNTIGKVSGDNWTSIPVVASDGVMDIGKYIDFHETGAGTTDYDARLTCSGGTLSYTGSIVNGYTNSMTTGTLQLESVNVTMASQALQVNTAYGSLIIGGQNATFCHMYTDLPEFVFNKNTKFMGSIRPYTTNTYYCGDSSMLWKAIYSNTGTIQTSDRNSKNTIEDLTPTQSVDFINALRPVSYKFNVNDSDRTHFGLISQEIEDTMTSLGMTSKDFAGFIKSPKKDEDDNIIENEFSYALRYDEFISPMIKVIQVSNDKIKTLETKINTMSETIELMRQAITILGE